MNAHWSAFRCQRITWRKCDWKSSCFANVILAFIIILPCLFQFGQIEGTDIERFTTYIRFINRAHHLHYKWVRYYQHQLIASLFPGFLILTWNILENPSRVPTFEKILFIHIYFIYSVSWIIGISFSLSIINKAIRFDYVVYSFATKGFFFENKVFRKPLRLTHKPDTGFRDR